MGNYFRPTGTDNNITPNMRPALACPATIDDFDSRCGTFDFRFKWSSYDTTSIHAEGTYLFKWLNFVSALH